MEINKDDILKLREETGAGVMEAKKIFEETGDFEKAKRILKKKGAEKAAQKTDREAHAGIIVSYVHSSRVGVMLELNCETDFVARGEGFQNLAKEIAMQIAAIDTKNVEELLSQPYIRDENLKISDLVTDLVSKVGENIVIKRFVRYQLGQ